MPEEKTTSFEDIFSNKLKTIDVSTLEQTIAEAVGRILEVELNCRISSITYENSSYSRTKAQFDVSLSESIDFNWGTSQEQSSEIDTRQCKLCDVRGFRFVETPNYPNGVMRKCSHNSDIESQIATHNLNQ